MKKIVLLGLLLSLSTGCGRGWMPCLSRGAQCGNAGCIGAPPALPQGCTTGCAGGNAAGYASYDGEIVSDYGYSPTEIYMGEGPAPVGSGPAMAPLNNQPARQPAP
jgi:hypothetical protein